jgi:hypothetical protein
MSERTIAMMNEMFYLPPEIQGRWSGDEFGAVMYSTGCAMGLVLLAW